ncbi:hypothetical protein L6R53_27395 [Myxococcota bacterium]|nr:hypothetical protein [Myxococcota bacterium]
MDLTDLLADGEVVLDIGGARAFQLPPARGAVASARRVDLVLSLLQRVGSAVVLCDDPPGSDGELPGEWVEIAPGQWRVPDVPLDLGELLDWLSAGTWQLVGFPSDAPTPVPLVDLFEDLEGAVADLGATEAAWLLDVFHDEQPWRLYLRA